MSIGGETKVPKTNIEHLSPHREELRLEFANVNLAQRLHLLRHPRLVVELYRDELDNRF